MYCEAVNRRYPNQGTDVRDGGFREEECPVMVSVGGRWDPGTCWSLTRRAGPR